MPRPGLIYNGPVAFDADGYHYAVKNGRMDKKARLEWSNDGWKYASKETRPHNLIHGAGGSLTITPS
jgi:hypothetical protein